MARLRGRKSPAEVERIRQAVALTEQVVALLTEQVRPGRSEQDLAAFVHEQFAELGVSPAWPAEECPTNCGPSSDLGHTYPSATVHVEPGHLVHIDLGVRRRVLLKTSADVVRAAAGRVGPARRGARAFDTRWCASRRGPLGPAAGRSRVRGGRRRPKGRGGGRVPGLKHAARGTAWGGRSTTAAPCWGLVGRVTGTVKPRLRRATSSPWS
ncbi:MAG: M24 family metallopeptidase [Gemmataceae bacterium]